MRPPPRLAQVHPKKIALSLKLDEETSHLIEAGADFFSCLRFSNRAASIKCTPAYGTVRWLPGGVLSTGRRPRRHPEDGTGIMFVHRLGIRAGVVSALQLHGQPEAWANHQARHERDFSWRRPPPPTSGLREYI